MKKGKTSIFAGAFIGAMVLGTIADAETTPLPEILPPEQESLQQWQAMRFGMFIHWGPVSLTAREIGWSRGKPTPRAEYDTLYKRFNPVKFNADEWALLAKQTGMKYMVLTAKHHDGFCLWDSKYTDYDIMSTPFKRDVVKELTDACRRHNIRFGPYYSVCDWYQPDYGFSKGVGAGYQLDREPDIRQYVAYMHNQLRELSENYGPFHVFWFDGEWEKPWTHEMGVDLNNFCRSLQPDVLINNRVDKGRRGMKGITRKGNFAGDYDTPEQCVGDFNRDVPWETCMTIGRQWAWKPNEKLKSLEECLHILIKVAGGDGNLLLNVGPMPDGRIEPRQADRLREIGAWLAKHGESIYGTRGGPFKPGKWGASTCKGKTIYLHLLVWPGEQLELPAIAAKIAAARTSDGSAVRFEQSEKTIRLILSERDRRPIDTIIRLQVDRDAVAIPAVNMP